MTVEKRYARARVRQVAAMLFVYATFYVCRLAFSASKKGMIEEGAYTPAEIGYVGSAMLFAYAIGKIVNGFIADRVNVKRYIMLGLFISSLANMVVGFHIPALMLAVIWFVNGFAQASGAPCCVVALSRWWPKNKRGTYYGIWSCSNNLGEVLAYIVSAGIVVWVGRAFGPDWAWKSCFWGATAFGLIGIAAASLFFGNAPEDEGLPPVPVDATEAKVDTSGGQRLALMSPAVWMIALAGGFFAASRYAVIDWGMFFLQVKKGYTEAGAATVISVNSIVGAVSSALSGIISDRFFKSSRKELAVAAGLLNITALSLFMLVPGRHAWLDVTAMVMFGFAVGILLTFLGGLMAVDYVPKCAAGAALGIAGLGNYIGAGLQSILSGYLIERAPDGTATLMGHTFSNGYTLDWLAVFWVGVAVISVLFTLAAGMGSKTLQGTGGTSCDFTPRRQPPAPNSVADRPDYVLKLERQVRHAIWGEESWEISVHPSGPSVIANGPLAGKSLAEVCPDFGLLIKVIDAKDRLSVQIHPNDHIAPLVGGEPKTEMWCLLSDGLIFAGLPPNTVRGEVAKAIANGNFEDLLVRYVAKKDEVYFIPGGEVHSIGEGTRLYEVQQSSDTTYRLYDWGRVGKDGRPRELHIEKGLKAINYSLPPPVPSREAECEHFAFSQHIVQGELRFGRLDRYAAIFAAEGTVTVNGETLAEGESALVPPGVAFTVSSARAHIFMTRSKRIQGEKTS